MSQNEHARRVAPTIACRVFGSVAVLAALYPLAASAQIEEVIVTTRKREESLQEVPIAVSVISAEQITRQGVTDLRRVVELQPSVKFDQSFGPADNRITIRGLSNTRGRSNVAFLVDGIDVTTENLVTAGSGLLANRRLLTDVQSIEIVKGPQSALYGRAAFAGAISYTTKEPGDELDGRVGLDIGDFGRRNLEAAVGGPITDTFGLRLTGASWNEDGFYRNSVSGKAIGQQEGYGMALTGVWKPADNVKSKLRFEYSDEEFGPRPVARIDADTPFYLPNGQNQRAVVQDPSRPDIFTNYANIPNGDARFLVRPIITGNPATQLAGSASSTNLFNFGLYCPGRPDLIGAGNAARGYNPDLAPGFCLPGVIGDSSGYQPTLSLDPETGSDFAGTSAKTFRVSNQTTIDVGVGTFTSYTGWTDFNADDIYDQDYQDAPLGFQLADTSTDTDQFSQEIRFRTELDGPVQVTVGALFWDERRRLEDRNLIISCAPLGRTGSDPLRGADGNVVVNGGFDPTTGVIESRGRICDGTANSLSDPLEVYRRILLSGFKSRPVAWEADTRHWSFYGALDWNITDELQMTLETRFVDEKFTLLRPAQSSCTEAAFSVNADTPVPWASNDITQQEVNALAAQGIVIPLGSTICDADRVRLNINPTIDFNTGLLNWRTFEGSTNSRFQTPKLTLKWQPKDDLNLYFSWAAAQKPGGINQLAAGGAPTTLENERFDPEKLDAWEIGLKTAFEAAGFWRLNLSTFLNDYTDKQVGIQTVTPDGVAQPRVVNAGRAQVWGFEFETVWQPSLVEGLTLSLAGTILDAKYTKFIDNTSNLVKIAKFGSCLPRYEGIDPDGNRFVTNDPNDPRVAATPGAQKQCSLDYSNNDLERTPDQSYAASAVLQRPFFDTEYEYLIQVEGQWQSERWTEPENLVQLDDYATMNVRLGLTSDTWEVLAYLDNALDQNRFTTAGSGPDFGRQFTTLGFTAGFGTSHYFATLPDPRVFGVRANFRFGPGR